MDGEDNIFQFGAIEGGKKDEQKFPINDYVVTDTDNTDWFCTGFLIFTPHHVAIMKSTELGAVPGLVIPIGRVKAAFVEDDDEQ